MNPSALQLIHADQVPPQPWRNGGGATRELFAWPPGPGGAVSDAWQLRISLADITRDGPFSAFAGVQRWFTVVQGAGVRLMFAGRPALALTTASAPVGFDGADAPGCALIDGPTRDLNLMARGAPAQQVSMQTAAAGAPWRPAQGGLRALFSAQPGQLHIGEDPGWALPALCLAVQQDAGTEAWCWQPDGGPGTSSPWTNTGSNNTDMPSSPAAPAALAWWLSASLPSKPSA